MTVLRHYAAVLVALILLGSGVGILQEIYQWGPWTLAGVTSAANVLWIWLFFWFEDRYGRYTPQR